eukprot:TRINITY_DN1075_c0_g2_i3.p1 TRINITY_DN1075_c0_g2~~TRINITY_DN1075_c0_g2_i3.p1  ORF type:complete len:1897 (+),score=362.85 TRINITY_DN1075_c0_g2_i3:70-5760(+)
MTLTELQRLRPLYQPAGNILFATQLGLYVRGISYLPDSISELKRLQWLALDGNRLSELPDDMSQLTNITLLQIHRNQFTYLPDVISHMVLLHDINFHSNPITELPEWITTMTNLNSLGLRSNTSELKRVPKGTSILPPWNHATDGPILRKLKLYNHGFHHNEGIQDVTPFLTEWMAYTKVDVSGNKLVTIPDSISILTGLKVLILGSYAGGNLLTELPTALSNMQHLKEMHLEKNDISEIPSWITRIRGLEKLKIADRNAKGLVRYAPIDISTLPCWFHPSEGPALGRLSFYEVHDHASYGISSITNLVQGWKMYNRLDISRNEISTIPDSISKLTQLENLKFGCDNGGNKISRLPDSMSLLTKLTHLDLRHNKIRELPLWFSQLTKLEKLIMDRETRRSPLGLSNIPCWKTDILPASKKWLLLIDPDKDHFRDSEGLTDINDVVDSWGKYTQLSLADNQLFSLPDSFGMLTNIRVLHLGDLFGGNLFTSLPVPIHQLKNLEELRLVHNAILEIPVWIDQLINLVYLDIRYTEVRKLPNQLGRLKKLKTLHLDREKITYPPPNVVARGTGDIVNFLFSAAMGGTKLWLEGRILLLGEGEVGKTTLCESLLQWNFFCLGFRSTLRNRHRTNGAEIAETSLTLNYATPSISARIWDFGGQDIFQVTHPFFLSSGALVLILYSLAKGPVASKLKQWLELVSYFCPGSRVIIVGTRADLLKHEDAACFEHDLETICACFEKKLSICARMKVSNLNGSGIEELKENIHKHMLALPNMNQLVPNRYLQLKALIISEKLKKPDQTRTLRSIITLCESRFDLSAQEAETALSFLRDLGVIVWYDREERLRDTVVINPIFLIDVFKSIFTIRDQTSERGFISSKIFSEKIHEMLLQDQTKLSRRVEIKHLDRLVAHSKQLFRHFGLSFEVDENWEVFPVLMPNQEPPSDRWKAHYDGVIEELHCILEYDEEIPKNIISRILIDAYHLTKQHLDVKNGKRTFFSRKYLIVPFSINEDRSSICPGTDYTGFIHFCDLLQDHSRRDNYTDMIVTKRIEVGVRTTLRQRCAKLGTTLLMDMIMNRIDLVPRLAGFCCPLCYNDPIFSKNPSLHELSSWDPNEPIFSCSSGHSIQQQDYSKHLLPVSSLSIQHTGNRTSKSLLSENTLKERTIRIYVAPGFQDRKNMRKTFSTITQPQIQQMAIDLGIQVIFVDLRLGQDSTSYPTLGLSISLNELKRCDYFLCFLDTSYGFVPCVDAADDWASRLITEHPWIDAHLECSAAEMEIRYAAISDEPRAYRSFFYAPRTESIQDSNQLMLMSELEGSFIVHKYTTEEELGNLCQNHILNALKADFNSGSQFPDRSLSEQFYLQEKTRIYAGRDDMRQRIELLLSLHSEDNKPFVIWGDAGIGKTSVIASLSQMLGLKTYHPIILTYFPEAISMDSASEIALVRHFKERLTTELSTHPSNAGIIIPPLEFVDFRGMVEFLGQQLSQLQFYIFIDDVDKIKTHKETLGEDLSWIPTNLSNNVFVILTTAGKHGQFRDVQIMELQPTAVREIASQSFRMYSKTASEEALSLISDSKPLRNPGVLNLFLSEIISLSPYEASTSKIEDYAEEQTTANLVKNIISDWEALYGSKIVDQTLIFYYLTDVGLTQNILEEFFKSEQVAEVASPSWNAFHSLISKYCRRVTIGNESKQYLLSNPFLRQYVSKTLLSKDARLDQAWSHYAKLLDLHLQTINDHQAPEIPLLLGESFRAHQHCIQYSNANRKMRLKEFLHFAYKPFVISNSVKDGALWNTLMELLGQLEQDTIEFQRKVAEGNAQCAVDLVPYLCSIKQDELCVRILSSWVAEGNKVQDDETRGQVYDRLATLMERANNTAVSERHRECASICYSKSRGNMDEAAITGRGLPLF